MSRTRPSSVVRQAVAERAAFQCEYCQTQSLISGQALQIDHIIPEIAGGSSDASNLCLACALCNQYKAGHTVGYDSESEQTVALFNPRMAAWSHHFRWVESIVIAGRTPIGRATVVVLKMNNAIIINARSIWAKYGLHPPG